MPHHHRYLAMQLARYLLLSAVAFAVAGVRQGLAEDFEVFYRVPASANCSARTITAAARGDIECAVLSVQSASSLSYSFINGVCVLSDSLNCAAPEAESLFMERPQHPGYEQQIDTRWFWVFQQRLTGSVLFNRTWVEYEAGFGDGMDSVATDFWSGLLLIYSFAKSHGSNLRIEATTVDGHFYVAEWQNFTLTSASTNYTLKLGAFISGSSNFTGDSFTVHRDQQFSTIDRDNDIHSASCSNMRGGGGFWWAGCMNINPNGLFSTTLQSSWSYLNCDFIESQKTLRYIRMMLQM